MKKRLEYLTSLFDIPNIQVNHFSLVLFGKTQTLEDLVTAQFHAKSVEIHGSDMNQTFLFLSAMNPGELESINLETPYERKRDQILRIFDTEQFKQAKHVHLNALLNEEDLASFGNSFKCELDFLEPVDFQRVRESEFYRSFPDDFQLRTIAEALGADIPFGPLLNTITHRYQIPESNDFLEFEIEEQQFHYIIKIVKVC